MTVYQFENREEALQFCKETDGDKTLMERNGEVFVRVEDGKDDSEAPVVKIEADDEPQEDEPQEDDAQEDDAQEDENDASEEEDNDD
jgi:hypothetical protein